MRPREEIELEKRMTATEFPDNTAKRRLELVLEVLLDIRDLLSPPISQELKEWNSKTAKGIKVPLPKEN